MRRSIHFLTGGASLLVVLLAAGCGGGRTDPLLLASLTGIVTDVDGSPVVAAKVIIGGRNTLTVSNGSWELYDIRPGYNRVQAEMVINGQQWTGETQVDVSGGEHNRNVNVVISDRRFHGIIEGYVLDNSSRPVSEAKVFVGGPISSTLAIADSNGFYRVPTLTPDVTYTVTASLSGYINDTKSLHVDRNGTTTASFRLVPGTPQGSIPAPQNVVAQAWTVSSEVFRAADTRTQGVYELLKRHYRRLNGLPENPKQASRIERRHQSRVTPDGSLIEIDLFWDYEAFEDLFGYAIRRATRESGLTDPQAETAIVRDPLTRVFFDVDYLLTPDITYYYTVHRLETVDFPPNGLIGPPSRIVNAAPLQPIYAESPPHTQVVANPVFGWSAASRVSTYRVYLWESFPELLSDTDPDGVRNIWTSGNSTSGRSINYTGPALRAGHTYYWMVVGETSDNSALTASEISKFRTP